MVQYVTANVKTHTGLLIVAKIIVHGNTSEVERYFTVLHACRLLRKHLANSMYIIDIYYLGRKRAKKYLQRKIN